MRTVTERIHLFEHASVLRRRPYSPGTDEERAYFLELCTSEDAKKQSAEDCRQFLSDRKLAASGGAGGVKRKTQQSGIKSFFQKRA